MQVFLGSGLGPSNRPGMTLLGKINFFTSSFAGMANKIDTNNLMNFARGSGHSAIHARVSLSLNGLASLPRLCGSNRLICGQSGAILPGRNEAAAFVGYGRRTRGLIASTQPGIVPRPAGIGAAGGPPMPGLPARRGSTGHANLRLHRCRRRVGRRRGGVPAFRGPTQQGAAAGGRTGQPPVVLHSGWLRPG